MAGEVTTIASRLDGWLVTRPVMEGDRVRKGQVLGELDSRDAQLRLAALEGNLAAIEAQIRETTIQRDTMQQTTDAQVADARAQLAAAEAAVEVAAHQADLARADFARADPLLGRGAISRQQLGPRPQHAAPAGGGVAPGPGRSSKSRRAALAQATAQLGQVSDAGAADRGAARPSVPPSPRRPIRCARRSPTASCAPPSMASSTAPSSMPGDYVQAGQWLMMMHDPDDVWVEANVKETDGRPRARRPARRAVTVDAYPELVLHGRVLRVGNAATNQFALLPSPNPSGNFTKITQRVPVRIAIDKPEHPLQPGLMVEVSIDVAD